MVRRIGVTRAHLEEDAGKLVHGGAASLSGSDYSLVDYNRAGVPLLEIVSEPDMRTGAEAAAYGAEIRRIMRFLGVSGAWDALGLGRAAAGECHEGDDSPSYAQSARRGADLTSAVTFAAPLRPWPSPPCLSATYTHACTPTAPPRSADGNMAEGSMRCDVNISVRPRGQAAFGTKVEIKNMNSFNAMQRAIDFEIARQVRGLFFECLWVL